MQPFDEKYMERREKKIQEMYETRSMAWACLAVGVLLGGISVPFLIRGGALGPILLVISLLFGTGAIFIFATTVGQKAADRAIQKEREELWALYSQSMEKPKRESQEQAVRLTDDGELAAEDSLEDQSRASAHRQE